MRQYEIQEHAAREGTKAVDRERVQAPVCEGDSFTEHRSNVSVEGKAASSASRYFDDSEIPAGVDCSKEMAQNEISRCYGPEGHQMPPYTDDLFRNSPTYSAIAIKS